MAGQDKQILVANSNSNSANRKRQQVESNNNNNNNNNDNDNDNDNNETNSSGQLKQPFKVQYVWLNIFLFVVLHSSIPIGVYMLINGRVSWRTLIWSVFGMYLSGLGVTGGSHRLWSHRSYKASGAVEILLMLLQTMAGQNSIYTWSRDHRVHHKYAETDADPHNIKRGFFFAHMGWLCCRKHPEVKSKGKLIDMSDLEANGVVMFQHRHFWWLSVICNVLAPTMVPVLLWQESFWPSFIFSFMIRYLITLHGTWLVNSAAHYYGTRPYDERIEARESPFVIGTGLGEGFHNYHHTFPFDYSTSEFGKYMNITTAFIDLCAALGLVHSRRKVDRDIILKRQLRTGDETGELKIKHNQKQQQLGQANGGHIGSAKEQQPSGGGGGGGPNGSVKLRLVELAKLDEHHDKMVHEMPYISGLTSMKYTM